MAKAAYWTITDVEARKRGEQTGLAVSYTHLDVYKRQQVDEERILRPTGEALLRNSAK